MDKIIRRKYVSRFTGREIEERLEKIDFLVNWKTDIIHDYTESTAEDKIPSMAAIETFKQYIDNQFEVITGSSETAYKFTLEYKDKVDRSTGHFRGVFATEDIRDDAHPDVSILQIGDACVVLNLDGNTVDQRWTGSAWENYSTEPANITGVNLVGGVSTDITMFDTTVNKTCKVLLYLTDTTSYHTHVSEIIMTANNQLGVPATSFKASAYAEVYTDVDLIDFINEKIVGNNAVLEIQTPSSSTLTMDIISLL